MKKQTRVIVFDNEEYDSNWPPEDAIECVKWFAGKLEAIPQEHRTKAKIEIGSARGWEASHYGHIKIYYDRPETDEEMACREAEELRRQEELKAQEIRTLEVLKAKYER